jgi:hypothetical protein
MTKTAQPHNFPDSQANNWSDARLAAVVEAAYILEAVRR